MNLLRNRNKYFRIYAGCILVKGHLRSLICDTQRNTIQFIPNDLYDILVQHRNKPIGEILKLYNIDDFATIIEYFIFLIKNEHGFLCDEIEKNFFPEIELSFHCPSIISNAIIDVNKHSNHNFNSIITQLENLGCRHFQLRSFDEKDLSFFENILSSLEDKSILSTEFLIKFTHETDLVNLKKLFKKYPRLLNIIVHSALNNKIESIDHHNNSNVIFCKQQILNESHCGFISSLNFPSNLVTISESQNHNTCLNKKVSIDVNGEIKNCPSMLKSFGNLRETSINNAIENANFKDFWFISKNQIVVCKDCEFRHVCTDCRAYIQDPNNIYSKPAKCSYDPYTATWGDENPTNNPLYGQ